MEPEPEVGQVILGSSRSRCPTSVRKNIIARMAQQRFFFGAGPGIPDREPEWYPRQAGLRRDIWKARPEGSIAVPNPERKTGKPYFFRNSVARNQRDDHWRERYYHQRAADVAYVQNLWNYGLRFLRRYQRFHHQDGFRWGFLLALVHQELRRNGLYWGDFLNVPLEHPLLGGKFNNLLDRNYWVSRDYRDYYD